MESMQKKIYQEGQEMKRKKQINPNYKRQDNEDISVCLNCTRMRCIGFCENVRKKSRGKEDEGK